MSLPFNVYRYFLVALDPLHVGTGGYRLGRVDLSIMREPGTRLPKIPGTSLHGALRHYAAYRYGKRKCADQKGQCARPTCPVCYTFGHASGDSGGYAGVVSIGDARIFLFPVYSRKGPLWVTTRKILAEAGFKVNECATEEACTTLPSEQAKGKKVFLNLGWLALEATAGAAIVSKDGSQVPFTEIKDRVVIVNDKLFSQVVNSNLEVRTSVSIDPATGAAADKALFTYEAIPRSTYLWLEAIFDDYRGAFPAYSRLQQWKQILGNENSQEEVEQLLRKMGYISAGEKEHDQLKAARERVQNMVQEEMAQYERSYLSNCRWQTGGSSAEDPAAPGGSETKVSIDTPVDVLRDALTWAEYLGVGGMGTRGFGRIRLVGAPQNIEPSGIKEGV